PPTPPTPPTPTPPTPTPPPPPTTPPTPDRSTATRCSLTSPVSPYGRFGSRFPRDHLQIHPSAAPLPATKHADEAEAPEAPIASRRCGVRTAGARDERQRKEDDDGSDGWKLRHEHSGKVARRRTLPRRRRREVVGMPRAGGRALRRASADRPPGFVCIARSECVRAPTERPPVVEPRCALGWIAR